MFFNAYMFKVFKNQLRNLLVQCMKLFFACSGGNTLDVRGTMLSTVAQPQFVVYVGDTNVTTVVAFMLLWLCTFAINLNLYRLLILMLL